MLPTLQPLLVGLLLGAQLVYTSPAGSTNLNRRANPPDIPDFERLYDGPLPPEPTNADDEYISCIAKWVWIPLLLSPKPDLSLLCSFICPMSRLYYLFYHITDHT